MAKQEEGSAGRAPQKLLRLKSELQAIRRKVAQGVALEPESLASLLEQWEEDVEDSRASVVDILARFDRMQITHDKLRERMDSQALHPRTDRAKPKPPSSRSGAVRAAQPVAASGESQDFSAIDAELSKLNESMLRAMSD